MYFSIDIFLTVAKFVCWVLLVSSCIVLQHFPMYRSSDHNCSTPDAAPPEEIDIPFRPKYDCLSEEASKHVSFMLICIIFFTDLLKYGKSLNAFDALYFRDGGLIFFL